MGFLQSKDEVKVFINDEFPVFMQAIDTIEIDESRCRFTARSISSVFPNYKNTSGREQILCLLIDFAVRLLAYNSTGLTHINSENIVYLEKLDCDELVVDVKRIDTSISDNASTYQATVSDKNGTEIALSTASQIIE